MVNLDETLHLIILVEGVSIGSELKLPPDSGMGVVYTIAVLLMVISAFSFPSFNFF